MPVLPESATSLAAFLSTSSLLSNTTSQAASSQPSGPKFTPGQLAGIVIGSIIGFLILLPILAFIFVFFGTLSGRLQPYHCGNHRIRAREEGCRKRKERRAAFWAKVRGWVEISKKKKVEAGAGDTAVDGIRKMDGARQDCKHEEAAGALGPKEEKEVQLAENSMTVEEKEIDSDGETVVVEVDSERNSEVLETRK